MWQHVAEPRESHSNITGRWQGMPAQACASCTDWLSCEAASLPAEDGGGLLGAACLAGCSLEVSGSLCIALQLGASQHGAPTLHHTCTGAAATAAAAVVCASSCGAAPYPHALASTDLRITVRDSRPTHPPHFPHPSPLAPATPRHLPSLQTTQILLTWRVVWAIVQERHVNLVQGFDRVCGCVLACQPPLKVLECRGQAAVGAAGAAQLTRG